MELVGRGKIHIAQIMKRHEDPEIIQRIHWMLKNGLSRKVIFHHCLDRPMTRLAWLVLVNQALGEKGK